MTLAWESTWLVRPDTPITAFARRIHGIGNDDVTDLSEPGG